jgi:glycosyltransferase involved in cell wall biosynthesis
MIEAGYNKEKITVINNFINDKYLETEPVYTNKNYFLYAGRLSKEKGVDILIKTMGLIPEANLHIVGTGPDEEEFKKLAETLNLKNIEFSGFKKLTELQEEYNNCIATIIPSNYFETFGLTITEAFSRGKPVIGSNIGGIPELIINNETGFTFELENIEDLADKIKFMMDHSEQVIEMGKNARKKVIESFNKETHLNKLLEVYSNAINKVVE